MSTDDELAALIEKAGQKTGERVWRMPLGPEYQQQIKGSHSDLVNIGGRSGGALTAGQFLSNFKPDGAAWAHLDIAGTAWDDKPRPENPKGASGVGVRLMYRFLSDLA
jgi:leucyl aminopeptidase